MKVLFITLSNIGDAVLTLPVLDLLRESFPGSRVTCLTGERPKEIFESNPNIERVIIYNKRGGLREKIKLFFELRKERFDLIVDLRNTFFGAFLSARHKTSPLLVIPGTIRHMQKRHLYGIEKLIASGKAGIPSLAPRDSVYVSLRDENYIDNILRENGIKKEDNIVIVAAGARSHIKRWGKDKFLELIHSLIKEFGVKVALVGDKDDAPIARYISLHCRYPIADLSAKTTLSQLACLLRKAKVVITNDSAVLHLASYLDAPTAAIFGPTREGKYGPWSKIQALVKKDIFCRPCEKAQCKFGTLDCLALVKPEDVLQEIRHILNPARYTSAPAREGGFKRILIARTDRIGDVLLSTPVIKALREEYPRAYIAMMVSPPAKDIVEGNPYLDEVIVYDKDGKHRSWRRSIKFTLRLRKKKFELAVILHPTNRVHLITFFARIPERVGYDRKLGFLLTKKVRHTKQSGQKHESEYALDLLGVIGIMPKDKRPFMPIKEESEKWLEGLFDKEGLSTSDKLLAVHPAASCPSKVWPNERFAEAADRLVEKFGFRVLVVAGPRDISLAGNLIKHMRHTAINLAGKTSISQLASLLKRCSLFISNDSGPVHIAASLGTPVISIFGRNQKGLSPKRWGPLGDRTEVLHKEVGCIECLAHNCVKGFACLKAISVDDVVEAAGSILASK